MPCDLLEPQASRIPMTSSWDFLSEMNIVQWHRMGLVRLQHDFPIVESKQIADQERLLRKASVWHLVPPPTSHLMIPSRRQPNDQFGANEAPSHFFCSDIDKREDINHHYPFLLQAQLVSFAPPSQQRVYIDVFGDNPWQVKQHRKTHATKSLPDPFIPYYYSEFPDLFFSICLPDKVSVHRVVKYLRIGEFNGLLAIKNLPRRSQSEREVLEDLVRSYPPRFAYRWRDGVMYLWTTTHPASIPTPLLCLDSNSKTRDFAIAEVYHVPAASKLHQWIALAPYLSATYLTPVLEGFVAGRTTDYQALDRDAPRIYPPYILSPAEKKFCADQTFADLQNNFCIAIPKHLFTNLVISPCFVRRQTASKWRKIVDPTASGVNGWVPKQEGYVFPTIDSLCSLVKACGKNSIIIIFDASQAYKQVPLAAADLHLHAELDDIHGLVLGTRNQWGHSIEGFNWVDVASVILHIINYTLLLPAVVYVDDYAVVIPPLPSGIPDWKRAYQAIADILVVCETALGITLAKWQIGLEVKFLGYLISSRAYSLGLPTPWCQSTADFITPRLKRRSLKVQELQSLIGKAIRIARIIPFTRPFLAALFKLAGKRSPAGGTAYVRISVEIRTNIKSILRCVFYAIGSRSSFIGFPFEQATLAFTDASGRAAAWILPTFSLYSRKLWTPKEIAVFKQSTTISIAAMEGFAILEVVLFLVIFHGVRTVRVFTDSQSFMDAFEKGYAHSKILNWVISVLATIIFQYELSLKLEFVPTKSNPADIPTRITQETASIRYSGKILHRSTRPWLNMVPSSSKLLEAGSLPLLQEATGPPSRNSGSSAASIGYQRDCMHMPT